MSTAELQILRPTPRRPMDNTLKKFYIAADDVSPPPTPHPEEQLQRAGLLHVEPEDSFGRTHSFADLTSSTLCGIYETPDYDAEHDDLVDPWGTGIPTPRESVSIDLSDFPSCLLQANHEQPPPRYRRQSTGTHLPYIKQESSSLNPAIRTMLLFAFGMGYGSLVTHLHDHQRLAPVDVEGIIKPSYDWRYLALWGIAGVALGSLMPWIDLLWERVVGAPEWESEKEHCLNADVEDDSKADAPFVADWAPVVRSIGVFVGIAFAIRKLAWTSTLQVSLTLALVNPVLWYLLDRTRTGFVLAFLTGLLGTVVLLPLNPEMVLSPAFAAEYHAAALNGTPLQVADFLGGMATQRTAECGTWIASVLFCSAVCLGNIGRRLAFRHKDV